MRGALAVRGGGAEGGARGGGLGGEVGDGGGGGAEEEVGGREVVGWGGGGGHCWVSGGEGVRDGIVCVGCGVMAFVVALHDTGLAG